MLISGGTVTAPESSPAARQHPGGLAARRRRAAAPPGGRDPRRGRRRGVPARAPRPRDARRRQLLLAHRPVGGALAARADRPARDARARDRRDGGRLPRVGGQRPRGRLRRHRAARRPRLPARTVPLAARQPRAATGRRSRAHRRGHPRLPAVSADRHPPVRRRARTSRWSSRSWGSCWRWWTAGRLRERHRRDAHDLRARHGHRRGRRCSRRSRACGRWCEAAAGVAGVSRTRTGSTRRWPPAPTSSAWPAR